MDIYYACRIGDLGEVQCYVEAGAKLTELDRYGNMCIYYAILCGHPRVVDYLFDQGVSIDIGTAEGSRYYLCACRNDVRELVRKRAQRSKQDDTSPLFRLCFGGELPRDHHLAQVHKALHNSKAKLATKHKTGFSALEYASTERFTRCLTLMMVLFLLLLFAAMRSSVAIGKRCVRC